MENLSSIDYSDASSFGLMRASDRVRHDKVMSAFHLANQYLRNSFNQNHDSRQKQVLDRLKKIHFYIATNDDSEHCASGKADATAYCPSGSLSVCVSLVDSPMNELVAVIIHEGSHASGVCDECQAEYITKKAMNANGLEYTNIGYPECFK